MHEEQNISTCYRAFVANRALNRVGLFVVARSDACEPWPFANRLSFCQSRQLALSHSEVPTALISTIQLWRLVFIYYIESFRIIVEQNETYNDRGRGG